MKTTMKTLLTLSLCFIAASTWAQKNYLQHVDPLIGSGGHGHVFVGANVPLGAVQLGPQNIYQGWDWSSGYFYGDNFIIGFSHNHLSGTGCADLGDICFMPYTGEIRTLRGNPGEYDGAAGSTYSHKNEKAEPGYYAVKLDNGVNVELTATDRVGYHHYEYGQEGTPRMLVDLENATGNKAYETYIRKIDENKIEGYRFSKGWAPFRKTFFYAVFSKPIKELRTYQGDSEVGFDEIQTKNAKAVITFDDDTREVYVQCAVSSVSCTNAKMNLETEAMHSSFEDVKKAAQDKWNAQLSLIDIEGTPRQKTIFYTALYHAFIAPNLYCDVNGQYRGMDDKIYAAKDFNNYTTLSLWDTYRQLHPLYTIIATEHVNDLMNSMLSIYDQNGKLPIWPLMAGETDCMPGYSSVPVIADAYLKGFKGFDADRALRYMVSTATNPKQNGVSDFMKYGYIPADSRGEATSICLEYAADDWGLALMAKKLGKNDIYETFMKRGHAYEQYWDKSILKCHPKMKDGSWYEPYDPFLANHRDHVGDFCEGNGWQYTFMVPQNPDGLVALHGSDDAFVKNLDDLFVVEGDLGEGAPPDVSGMIGMYAHGNEPVHHVPYLYAYAGAQYKTAEKVRLIQETQYTDQPDGYCGNEDCGQMSAWHVMSALGFYQVNPSNGVFVMGSPLFKKATINLPNGKKFVINSPKNSDKNIYIKSAKLNGKAYAKSFVTYEDIMNGGELDLTMASKPNKNFGKAAENRPVSAK
jgi:predicted alpha-1,2-mannosidase